VGTEQSALQVSGTVAMAPCWAGCSMNTAQTREGAAAAAAAAAPSLQTLPVMLSVLLQRHLTLLTAAHCPSPYLLHTGLDPPPAPIRGAETPFCGAYHPQSSAHTLAAGWSASPCLPHTG
jgi:hypothetical protein